MTTPARSLPPSPASGSSAADATSRASLKRARILRAAAEVSARKGFEATRMEEIASLAGVSKGTLYNFFRSKEDLFIDTVIQAYADYRPVHPDLARDDLPPLHRLLALIEAMVASFDQMPDQVMLSHQAWSLVPSAPEATRDRLFDSLRALYADHGESLVSLLDAAIASGEIRSDTECERIATMWLALYDGLLYRATFEDPRNRAIDGGEGLRQALHWLLEMILTPGTRLPILGAKGRAGGESGGPRQA